MSLIQIKQNGMLPWTTTMATIRYMEISINLGMGSSTSYTPSKWGNQHRWEIITPKRILEDYGVGEYLTEEEIDYIVQEGNVEVERWKNR